MPTLEQQRAAFAWEKVQPCTDEYKNLVKGAPAFIMNNGLMQAMAFYQSKEKDHHFLLNRHLCEWLQRRSIIREASFKDAMKELQQADSATYRLATEEVLAVLKWIRQFAAAVA
ncbi:type III-B CRISPR module-associated protein Cmr5 [Methylocaldum szegediense]|uniref:CRISPR type III-B/RAMP module-associated protein Cmr5 n=1 Tax=Methylocaldum szegediense TaxID=73780 RepID=A0ABM9HYI4_9GAMM|nr:type III-B CRISPR module-associated protein Cmr5 [Methylocaldum szegediense]CAI8771468.1 CRISPR-associated protein Cmr5 [Methylocaldum szegediense]